jgi:hypothetical protein
LRIKKSFVALVFSLAAFPLWAAHTYSTDWSPINSITIGTAQIQPGQYQLKAEEGKLEVKVMQKNKVVATVPCHWKQLPAKPHDSEIVTDGGKVTEVQFSGSIQAVEID